MKKIIKVVALVLILILIIFFIFLSLRNKNNDYLDSISKDIKDNYKIEEKITYSNKYGNYYIFTTKKKVIVLNKEYEKVLKEDIKKLAKNKKNYPLIYKNNKLLYEETILKNNKLTYKYYDATNNKLVKETTMEKQ